MKPTYFSSPQELRRWFANADELLVGFSKTTTGTPSVTWPEAVDYVVEYVDDGEPSGDCSSR